MADTILGTQNNYRSLSISDLLEARDLYHYHLINKENVVGTAVGLYLIRKSDPRPDPDAPQPTKADDAKARNRGERTLVNSEVRDYSWPCVLAFVKQWVDDAEFGRDGVLHPEDMVPKTLYLPDGHMVPVCVVKVDSGEPETPAVDTQWQWPVNRYAPGMPVIVESQGVLRRATVGCLVTDGHTTYALTNRHVTGDTGEPIMGRSHGRNESIGHATQRCITRLPFTEVYPEYPPRKTFVNIDVGLIALDDINRWTSQPLGLPPTGALADLNQMNITTRLIEARVVGSGAASGRLNGRIKALFYRYKSVGGYEYVSDFLIAPEDPEEVNAPNPRIIQTREGDSGTVWHLVTKGEAPPDTKSKGARRETPTPEVEYRPLAVEWGGQVLAGNGGERRYTFALATSLTTVCRALDVELVAEHNTGAQPFWGQSGHYTIATVACAELPQGSLRQFFEANVDRISFDSANLTVNELTTKVRDAKKNASFVPLADVPDIVWKTFKTKPGGRDDKVAGAGRTTGPEHPTHFADIDEPGPPDGKTLRALSLEDPATNLTVAFWQQFYTSLNHTESRERGALPFRVWQFFREMVQFASAGDAVSFLCAAGCVAHYVGDACQPLHGSMYADGFSDQATVVQVKNKKSGETVDQPSHVGAGVHSTYESAMIDRNIDGVVTELLAQVGQTQQPVITTGEEAALEIVKLMDRCATAIPPTELIRTYVDAGGKNIVAVKEALWQEWGEKTVAVMADGARVLAAVWAGAWAAGNGDGKIKKSQLGAVSEDDLDALYRDVTFVPSLDLDHIAAALG
jgi:hypothetical protein